MNTTVPVTPTANKGEIMQRCLLRTHTQQASGAAQTAFTWGIMQIDLRSRREEKGLDEMQGGIAVVFEEALLLCCVNMPMHNVFCVFASYFPLNQSPSRSF